MAGPKELKHGDPCPNCGGDLTVDPRADPTTLAERHARNADKPDAAARYAAHVHETVAEHGLLYSCGRCPYQARFKAA